MKRIIVFLQIIVFVGIICGLSACNVSSAEVIESIGNFKTIYRHFVKEVQLLNASSDTDEILERTTDFKYYYDTNGMDTYYSNRGRATTGQITREDTLQCYFPKLTLSLNESSYGYYCNEYNCTVKIRAILNGIDKEYRPSYSVDGQLVTIQYYTKNSTGDLNFDGVYKNEIDNRKLNEIKDGYQRKVIELGADSQEFSDFVKEQKETYKYSVYLLSNRETYNLQNFVTFNVVYKK